MKSGDTVQGILVRRPEMDNMAKIMSSARLTDEECQDVINKYSAVA
jgi:hypothetical protein